jgi:beta-glucosidase
VAAAHPRTVVVLMGGGAILGESWRRLVPAILLLWYPGQEGGHALADVLLGRVSPSGRLPFAVPTDAAHLPPFEPRAPRVTYDLWHGYRRLRRQGHPAAFPFGFGLSYAHFRPGDLAAELTGAAGEAAGVLVAVTVHNDGPMAADEVVQVYVEPPAVAVERPERFLAGFARLALRPHQAERVVIPIPLRRLAYFDESRDAFVVEGGEHRVRVARHAEDEGMVVTLWIDETVVGP